MHPRTPYLTFTLPNSNITYKEGVGDYAYNAGKPHAVTDILNPEGAVPSLTQDITYTSFNKTATVTEGDYELELIYGPADQRRQSILWENSQPERTVTYSGNYEIVEVNNETYEVHYITCGPGLVAINVRHNNQDELFYVYTDHLGSILTLTDESGNIVFEQNFDPWGVARNADDWTYSSKPATPPDWLIRGFTGHEHLPEFGLINMNGRVYDPILSRVNSPDNFVQEPGYSQSYNRYSYVWNNPLVYTDPDGEWVHIAVGAVVGGGINLAANWNNIDGFGEGLAAFGVGAGSGALAAATGGASLGVQLSVAAGTAALTSATNNVIAQTDNFRGPVNWGSVGQSAFIGGVSGLAGFGAARGVSSAFKGDIVLGEGFRISGRSIPGMAIKQGLAGFAGGYAGGFSAGYLYTGDVGQAHQFGLKGGYLGGGLGVGFGAGSAYYNARRGGYNAWTGKYNQPVTPSDLRGITKPTTLEKGSRQFEIIPRTQGTSGDASASYHVIEIVGGNKVSITQIVVSPNDVITHQHQYSIGQSGNRYYNPNMSDFPTIDLKIRKN